MENCRSSPMSSNERPSYFPVHGHKNAQRIRLRDREIEFLKAEDAARGVLHEYNLIPRLFTDVLARAFREPDGERLALAVVEHLYFGHICLPSLIASAGYAVIKKP